MFEQDIFNLINCILLHSGQALRTVRNGFYCAGEKPESDEECDKLCPHPIQDTEMQIFEGHERASLIFNYPCCSPPFFEPPGQLSDVR